MDQHKQVVLDLHCFKRGYQASRYECVVGNSFSYFSTNKYAVGTQKNPLKEMVLLNTQSLCLNCWVRKQ